MWYQLFFFLAACNWASCLRVFCLYNIRVYCGVLLSAYRYLIWYCMCMYCLVRFVYAHSWTPPHAKCPPLQASVHLLVQVASGTVDSSIVCMRKKAKAADAQSDPFYWQGSVIHSKLIYLFFNFTGQWPLRHQASMFAPSRGFAGSRTVQLPWATHHVVAQGR